MIVIGILFAVAVVTGAVGEKVEGQNNGIQVCYKLSCSTNEETFTERKCTQEDSTIRRYDKWSESQNSLFCDELINECAQNSDCDFDSVTRETETPEGDATKSYKELLLSTYGLQCVRKYSECPDGKVNFLQAIEERGFKLNGNLLFNQLAEILKYIVSDYQICLSKDKLEEDVIPVYVDSDQSIQVGDSGTLGKSVENDYGLLIGADLIVPRVCAKGSYAMQSYYGEKRFWGCCPSGYEFINEFSTTKGNPNWQTYSGCCPSRNGFTLSGFDYNENNNAMTSCTYKNLLSGSDETKTNQNFIESGERIITINTENSFILGHSVSPSFNGYGNDNKSIAVNSNQKIVSEFVCPDKNSSGAESSCAVSKQALEVPKQTLLQNSFSGNVSVFSPDNFDEIALECVGCFTAGSPVAVTDSKLLICKSDAALEEIDLINNSVNDTLAWLRTDAENKDLLKTCRERGGIYIFVGCVDPTPLGFITGLIRITLGVVGGVALLQLIWVGILLQSGQEKKIAAARKNLMATLTGVAVLVFSILILRILGVNVLDILPAGSV